MPADSPIPRPKPEVARLPGVAALTVFFAAGTLISGVSALALAFPGSWLEPMWRLNPPARVEFARLGQWSVLLMVAVALACGGAAAGLWTGRRWGHRLAVGVLGCNLLGDVANTILRGDRRTLLGLPVGGAMLAYLLSGRVRHRFRTRGEVSGSE